MEAQENETLIQITAGREELRQETAACKILHQGTAACATLHQETAACEILNQGTAACATLRQETAACGILLQEIAGCEKLLVGIGEEWEAAKRTEISSAYGDLERLIRGKDYFIVTTVTDARIWDSPLDPARIVAPCGNETWRQCSESCTKDIWEPKEIPDDICPHCGAPLTGNTILAKDYIEEGYLPQWKVYTEWLARTLNHKLLALELGVGFQSPTVIRWPFEKTVYFNKKARMYRIHGKYAQISPEIRDKAVSISENSVEFILSVKQQDVRRGNV